MTDNSSTQATDSTTAHNIASWRTYVSAHPAINADDVDELESSLLDRTEDLQSQGLDPDEAFLIAVKRFGAQHEVSREFAQVHSDRLWKQLVVGPQESPSAAASGVNEPHSVWRMLAVALACAGLARLGIFIMELLFKTQLNNKWEFFIAFVLASLVFTPLAAFFGAMRRAPRMAAPAIGVAVLVVALCLALGIFGSPVTAEESEQQDQALFIFGLATAVGMWSIIGVGYIGGRLRDLSARMDLIRFTGEFVVYYGLIAAGGMLVSALGAVIFNSTDFVLEGRAEAEFILLLMLLPIGAVVVAAWLVEAKKQVIENILPVLAAIFAPIALVLLVSFIVTFAVSGGALAVDRYVLIASTGLLALVFGLVLYSLSARDSTKPAGVADYVNTALVCAALLMDLVILQTMASRIVEFGWSPNKVVTLGFNLLLVVNLTWAGWQYVRFCQGKLPQAALENWQTRFLPAFVGFALIVMMVVGHIQITSHGV